MNDVHSRHSNTRRDGFPDQQLTGAARPIYVKERSRLEHRRQRPARVAQHHGRVDPSRGAHGRGELAAVGVLGLLPGVLEALSVELHQHGVRI